jgi:hypothetical protein
MQYSGVKAETGFKMSICMLVITPPMQLIYDMAGSQTLLWQQVKNSCIPKITRKTSKA